MDIQSSADQLLSIVSHVRGGGDPMTNDTAHKGLQAFARLSPVRSETENLTPREQQVIDFLAKGYLYKEIADQLSISYGTVHTHTERVFKKLHVRSRAQAVAKNHLGDIARKVLQTLTSPSPARSETENLTPREREVIDFLAKGYLYKEIAEQLKISYSTVHTYVERIFKKLHVRSRAQAVAKYFRD